MGARLTPTVRVKPTTTERSDLPDFGNPPVIEVALAVGFQPLPRFRIVDFGSLWEACYREEFPKVEIQPPLPVSVEQFEQPSVQAPTLSLQLATVPDLPRVWFLDNDESQLVQVQNNWFARNWRKTQTPTEYPHYRNLKEPFELDLRSFVEHAAQNNLGEFRPIQCELSYFNHIVLNQTTPRSLADIISVVDNAGIQGIDFEPDGVAFNVQGVIKVDGRPVGRLFIKADPAIRRTDLLPIVVLSLTVKGEPIGSDIAGVMSFLDMAHERIVRAFAEITRPSMHAIWGKK